MLGILQPKQEVTNIKLYYFGLFIDEIFQIDSDVTFIFVATISFETKIMR